MFERSALAGGVQRPGAVAQQPSQHCDPAHIHRGAPAQRCGELAQQGKAPLLVTRSERVLELEQLNDASA